MQKGKPHAMVTRFRTLSEGLHLGTACAIAPTMTRTDTLDTATRAETAFASWDAFLSSCRAGYLPTLGWSQDARRLAIALSTHGCQCWRPAA